MILEDHADDAELMVSALRRGGLDFGWTRVETESDFIAALEDPPDAVLADYSLPGFDALRALALLQARHPDIPLLVVTGTLGDEAAVECIRLGAADYLLKDRPARMAKAIADALERKRLIAEKQRSEHLRTAIINAALDCVITVDRFGAIVDFNPASERTFGYRHDEAIGQSMADLIIPHRFREAHRHGFARLMATGAGRILGRQIELAALRKDGSEFPIELTITATGSPDEPLFTGHVRDITARVAAQQALKQSEARFRSFMENWVGRASIRDAEGRYKFVNAAWLKAYGFDETRVLDRTPEEIFSAEHAASVREAHRQVLASAAPLSRIVETESGKEGRTWVAHQFPIPDSQGQTAFVGTIAVDVSEQRAQDDRIRRLNRIYAVTSGINSAIVRARDRVELFKEACRIAVDHGNFGLAWVGAFDALTLDVTPVAWAGFGSEELYRTGATAREDTPQGRGVLGRAIRERIPVFDNDVSLTPAVGGRRREEAVRLGYRSAIVLPLFAEGAVAGVLSLFAKGAGFFNDEEVKLLTELAANLSFALDHIAGRQRLEKLQRVRAVTSAINSAIIRSESREALFDEACRIAVESGGFGIAWVGTLDPKTLDIEPVASAGIGAGEFIAPSKASARTDHPRGQGVAGRAVREGMAAIDNDLTVGYVGGTRREEALRRGYQSRIGLPLRVDNAVFGVLVLYAREKDLFAGEELHLLTGLAGNISFALETMAKQEKIEKLSKVRAMLSETNISISRIHDRDALLRETCRIAVKHGRFPLAWIGACNEAEKSLRAVAWHGFSDEAANAITWASIESVRGTMSEAIQTRRPSVRNDIDPGLAVGALRKEALAGGHRSIACIPLLDGNRVIALLDLFAPGCGFFDTEELSMLEELTADVSLALQAISRREEVEFLSYYDTLTGLPNRALFLDRGGQQLRARGGEDMKVALVVLNLERFRNVNDSFGRHGGDQLLKLIAARLEAAFRGKDYLARIGADSFGIIIRGVRDAPTVMHAVEDQALGCFRTPFEIDGNELHVSVKAGIALFPNDGVDPDSLIRNAEAALKKARDSGERYLFYSADMNARASQLLSLESRLRRAVEARQFVLHYQPKLSLASRTLCGFEALIRWAEPGKGLVPPGTFIPLLEETGLILPVGEWALAQALRDRGKWTERGFAAPRIAVNVSAIQLQQRQFPDMVIGVLQEAGADPGALELEITESLLMRDVEASIGKLTLLRGLGVHIAMDDFGTGYSSLSYIARLPIDSVKIDRTFISGMTQNAQDMSIVTTIITLAHSLNLRVIAEGVETDAQSRLLALLKCDEGQGYVFSKPVPEDVACTLLESSGGLAT